ncbi:HD domain-containing phosphohydrolase [Bacillus carboniphilus]|uniref:HD domain-containing phosphohydrolase n=1 Tax=Bacillus carboniphilus TaxID=86663 RepID=A0ABY9JRD2_9BACI|nr:HD domain-containing phosphohydrolase [Bacillus carboniphilus]WLR41892.1 HD domain-containing phosphohydrolase [Bacillus carboniphilus]
MKINIQNLHIGSIISKDVYSKTAKPIIYRDTVVTEEVINLLNVFLIENVYINQKIMKDEEETEYQSANFSNNSIEVKFKEVANEYRRLFKSWQSGSYIDIASVRNVILPLIEIALKEQEKVFNLYKVIPKNEYLYYHSSYVAVVSAILANNMKYSLGDINQLSLASFLIDSGMSKIDEAILIKEGPLTNEEMKELRQHPLYSYQLVKDIPSLKEETVLAVMQHHERMDGSGYPLMIKKESIRSYSRIISVVDSFCSAISVRPYRRCLNPFTVMKKMLSEKVGKYDLTVIDSLKAFFINSILGTRVKLSNGQVGEIVFIDDKNLTKPIVKVNDEVVNLLEGDNQSIEIVDICR